MAPSRNRRPGFSRRAQYGLFLGYVAAVAGALIGAALLVLSTLHPPSFAVARSAIAEVTTPISSASAWLVRGIIDIPGGLSNYFGVVNENRRLRAEVEQSRALLMRARTLSRENARLTHLLAVRERAADPIVTARLVSSSASSTRRFAMLNAGQRQGVRRGQPVRGPEGLIGQVVEAGLNTARVMLIVDPESAVPVRRTRDGLAGIATGRGDGLVEVRSVLLANVPFRPGDVFVTSGVGGIFAPGIPVARVVSRSGDSAVARVYAHPDLMDYALVQHAFMPMPRPQPPERAP
jgi:rod shape-determining protein MreC